MAAAVAMAAALAVAVAAASGLLGCGGDDAVDPVDAGLDAAVDAAACSGEPCSILEQCGCEETPTTPVCDLDLQQLSSGATACRPIRNPGDETSACTRPDQCAGGFVCAGFRCQRYCDDDDDCPGAGGLCILPLLSMNEPIPGVTLCTTDCDPTALVNPTCPPSWACHLYVEGGGAQRWLTNCDRQPATGGELGATCTSDTGCNAGLDCFNSGDGNGSTCHPNCRCPGGDCDAAVCPEGTATSHANPMAFVGPDVYGVCFEL
jgi:hypothetical protein